jgi:hypothetical protein
MDVEPIESRGERAEYDRLLVEAWGLVERIGHGYDDSLAEYREHIGCIADSEVRARLEQEVTEIDRRVSRGNARRRAVDRRAQRPELVVVAHPDRTPR